MLGTFADLLINAEANEHVAEFVREQDRRSREGPVRLPRR